MNSDPKSHVIRVRKQECKCEHERVVKTHPDLLKFARLRIESVGTKHFEELCD